MSSTTSSVRLCEASTKLEQDWRTIYETAFPAGEREPETRLQQLINDGRLLFHKTTGKQGELLCFSMISLLTNFSFLAYIATDPNQRSGGYGSKHMKELIQLLKNTYPNHLGLFLEIESTSPKKTQLSSEERATRQRRYAFYKRLGAKRVCRSMDYRAPSHSGDGTEHEFDLLFFNFTDKPLSHTDKSSVVCEIFVRLYELDQNHNLVKQLTTQAAACGSQSCEDDVSEIKSEDSAEKKCDASVDVASKTDQVMPADKNASPASGGE